MPERTAVVCLSLRDQAVDAGAQGHQEDSMNTALRQTGCHSEAATRQAEPAPSPSPRRAPSTQAPRSAPDRPDERIRELCDAYIRAVARSAGPPVLPDSESALLFERVAGQAAGTPLQAPIQRMADGFRRGDDYIDQGPVMRHCRPALEP